MTETTLNGPEGWSLAGFLSALGCQCLLENAGFSPLMKWGPDRRPTIRVDCDIYDVVPEIMKKKGVGVAVCEPDSPFQDIKLSASKKNPDKKPARIRVTYLNTERFRSKTKELIGLGDWKALDVYEALGTDVRLHKDKDGVMHADASFLMGIPGGSGQSIFKELQALHEKVTPDKVRKAMSEPWRRQDIGHSLHYDASECLEGPKTIHCEWGGYRLAMEALPLYPASNQRGVSKDRGFFCWPLWDKFLSLDAIRTLLDLPSVCREPNQGMIEERKAQGITAVFRAQRKAKKQLNNDSYYYFSEAVPG